jgi:hypothetical protein
MPLTKPPLAEVSPGQPVTAQGWNGLLAALSDLFDAVLAFGTGLVVVDVVFGGQPVLGADVVAVPVGDGQPVRAVPPFGDRTGYSLVGMSDGSWNVQVAAPGFNDETIQITVPRAEALPVNLTRRGSVVPDLFGLGLRTAMDRLREVGMEADLVFDTTGREIPRASLPPEYVDAPVLVQEPRRGEVAPPENLRARLVVASALRRDPVVKMPSLIGLSSSEAAQVLERLGLSVGTVTVQNPT